MIATVLVVDDVHLSLVVPNDLLYLLEASEHLGDAHDQGCAEEGELQPFVPHLVQILLVVVGCLERVFEKAHDASLGDLDVPTTGIALIIHDCRAIIDSVLHLVFLLGNGTTSIIVFTYKRTHLQDLINIQNTNFSLNTPESKDNFS